MRGVIAAAGLHTDGMRFAAQDWAVGWSLSVGLDKKGGGRAGCMEGGIDGWSNIEREG